MCILFFYFLYFFWCIKLFYEKCQKTICYVRVLTFLYQYRDDLVQKKRPGEIIFSMKTYKCKTSIQSYVSPCKMFKKCLKSWGV